MHQQQKNQSPNRTTILNQQTTTLLANFIQQQSTANFKDTLISLQFRMRTLQKQINMKMERQECLTLIQRKSNVSYVKKCFQELYQKIELDRKKDEGYFQKMQQQQKIKISQLKKRLKQINNTRQGTQICAATKDINIENMSKKINKILVKPQQLYLQSNQTMFSMLIDEIKELKQKDSIIQRLIQSKHKKTISLNNEVCRKLQHLQCQIQQNIKLMDKFKANMNSEQFVEPNKKLSKKNSSKILEKTQYLSQKCNTNIQNQAYEHIRLQLLSKSVQSIQRQLSQKLNIKDFIPLIKQNLPSFQQNMIQIKSYVEQNFQSMRKILMNQSQINQQMSKANKLAWWHCYDKIQQGQEGQSGYISQRPNQYILFSKEIMNIIPENLVVEEGEQHTLKILNKGWYLIHVYGLSIQDQQEEIKSDRNNQLIWLEINNGPVQYITDKKLLNLSANSQIRLLTKKQDLFVQVQKL